jgi:hypothetical protein
LRNRRTPKDTKMVSAYLAPTRWTSDRARPSSQIERARLRKAARIKSFTCFLSLVACVLCDVGSRNACLLPESFLI